VCVLAAGDGVPADGVVSESRELVVDEAALHPAAAAHAAAAAARRRAPPPPVCVRKSAAAAPFLFAGTEVRLPPPTPRP
jgi:magnesium-transporting ATPase (P-type)